MTVVVALQCDEGIVLAADSQETAGFVRRRARKLFDVSGRIAWGAAGGASLVQRLEFEAPALAPHADDVPMALRDRILEVTLPVQRRALDELVALPNVQPPTLEVIFCWCSNEEPHILQVTGDGASSCFRPAEAAIGSGGPFAQVALASMAHLDTRNLNLEGVKMVAYKAVDDTIVTSAFGVGPPIQMYEITTAAGGGARWLTDMEVSAIRDSVETWKATGMGPLPVTAEAAEPTEDEADDPGLEPPADQGAGDPGDALNGELPPQP